MPSAIFDMAMSEAQLSGDQQSAGDRKITREIRQLFAHLALSDFPSRIDCFAYFPGKSPAFIAKNSKRNFLRARFRVIDSRWCNSRHVDNPAGPVARCEPDGVAFRYGPFARQAAAAEGRCSALFSRLNEHKRESEEVFMSTENGTGLSLYFVDTDGPVFGTEQDALDLLGQTYGKEIDVIVVPANRFSPDFYDLSSRLAGHFFQKMQNYRMRLVILGDISVPMAASEALRDFVSETNRMGHHLFVAERTELEDKLRRND